MPDILSATELTARLATRWLGRPCEVHQEIDSTNSRALALARGGATEGTLILAEHQTAGRGRLGRRWFAPQGSSLLLSLILRPALAPAQAQRVAMVCSLAAIEAIEATCALKARVKWPNDIVLRGRKLGGMLAELGLRGARLDYVVLGLGLNVNLDPALLPEAMVPPTSLMVELGQPVLRLDLLVALLERLEPLYERMVAGWSPHASWRDCLDTLGQNVRVGTPEEIIEGLAEDVDADGALVVRTADGGERRILVGDVTLRGHRVG